MIEALPSVSPLLAQPLLDHVVQSTLFLAIAGLLILALQKTPARARHWVWLAASVKFLIPFAWLVRCGGSLSPGLSPIGQSRLLELFESIGQSDVASMPASLPVETLGLTPMIITATLAVWLAGFLVFVISWLHRWRRLMREAGRATEVREGHAYQAMARLAKVVGIRRTVRLSLSRSALEPAVYGVLRPVLMLPSGILTRLTPAQLDAILSHELSHIRRQDNFTGAIHMFVQAVFWFHPLVWWLGARIVKERECACDEVVLHLGSNPEHYAEGILTVCKYCVGVPLPCVSGVTGSNLKHRVRQIMLGGAERSLDNTRRALLVVMALLTLVGPLVCGLVFAPRTYGQSRTAEKPEDKPSFAVVSIKPSGPETRLQVQFAPGGRLKITHATLRFLIKIAYDIGDDQIGGGPGWVESNRFDLEGKPENALGGDPKDMTEDQRRVFREQIRLRLQRVLADRFGLELRSESKNMPIYALTVSKKGMKLKAAAASAPPSLRGGRGHLIATNVNMDLLAGYLSEQSFGRAVQNETQLNGSFDFKLDWVPAQSQTLGPADLTDSQFTAADATGPSLGAALQQQLGLRLESRKAAADYFVIARAAIPTEN